MGVKRQRGCIWKELGEKMTIIKTQNTLNKILQESVKQTNNNNNKYPWAWQEAYLSGNSRFCKINI